MALAHKYHPHCGCYSCCRQEMQDEKADLLAVSLHASPSLLFEVMGELTNDQGAELARLLAGNDDLAFAERFRRAVDAYIEEQIETRMDRSACSRMEAVQQMLSVYSIPKRAPRLAVVS
jgi:hypothetical protein